MCYACKDVVPALISVQEQNPNGILNFRGWKRRWFVLDNIALAYSKSEHEDPIKVNLSFWSISVGPINHFLCWQVISLSNVRGAQCTKDGQFEVVTNIFMENRKPRTFVLRVRFCDCP